MKQYLLNNLKNLPGWRTDAKLVLFLVDDYGSVRLDSLEARESLAAAGLRLDRRFDRVDALETRQDLEATLEALSSVSDCNGRPAVFTAYALCANPDFDAIRRDLGEYHYESLPDTFVRLAETHPAAYQGAWKLWQEGIRLGMLRPQFHGREHLNVELFERKLRRGDDAMRANLANNSLAALDGENSMPGVEFTHAFGLWERAELEEHRARIADGLQLFRKIFGFHSQTFTPPGQKIHPDLYPFLDSEGIRGVFKPRWCRRRIERDHYVQELNLRETSRRHSHVSLMRNVVFEPSHDLPYDPVEFALKQIAAAFRWRKPALISSHRVNFSGHIDPRNRKRGIDRLTVLLRAITERWPDAQFVGADELINRICPEESQVTSETSDL